MAKKEFNAQDIFFESEQASIEDRYPHRGKDPNAMKGFYKFMEQKRSDKPHSDKGFTNTMTCPYVVDVAKRDRLERIADKAQVGVLIEGPEGWVLLEKK